MTRPFRVVTHKRWLAEQFAPMGAILDHGFDIDPSTALDTFWWAPGAWVASARLAGVKLPLMSCGPSWLTMIPKEYVGRRVQNKLLADIFPGTTKPTFAKLPEVKHDGVPAQVYSECYLRDTLAQYGLPEDTIWQLQEPVEFVTEARFWIAHRKIVASSPYRHRDWVWGEENRPIQPLWDNRMSKMTRFMELVLGDLYVPIPPGCVIDIGILEGGTPKIIEANAAWSSGPYDGDPAGIFEAIKAAHDFEGKYPQWAWTHSPVFNKARPLKILELVAEEGVRKVNFAPVTDDSEW